MDALKIKTLEALQTVICDAEDLEKCMIVQHLDKEELVFSNELGQVTTMNCAMSSVGATIRQICSHINKHDLFSYQEGYTIGM